MSSEDISRLLLQPRKRYSGVRMQQGRVLTDADWNEQGAIDNDDERRTLMEIVCSKGTPNQGFAVEEPVRKNVTPPTGDPVETYDFALQDGSFYLGGLRHEIETDDKPETFLRQTDWLQIDADAGNLPTPPTSLPANGVRHDLVYLRGWEQTVTAVEDSELREPALGGPDTTVRLRRMRQIEVLTDVPDTCAAAFAKLRGELAGPLSPDTGTPHVFDAASCELKSKARLTIAPDEAGITDDPCRPAVPGGYLGADNQTLRVQLTATNRFIWGFDNAAPLYRVQVQDIPNDANGARRRIGFLNLPRDQAAQPLAGQAVEIIPWGALLPNQEKVAGFQGRLFTVATSYDPADDSLTLAEEVPEAWIDWLADHGEFRSERDPADQQQYLYLRLWTGGSGDATVPDHAFTPDTPVALAGIGLSAVFNDHGLPGDYWVIAARPHTPALVLPWELLDGAPPVGPRYFFAPLALIRWSLDVDDTPQAQVQDCRERFQPLCEVRGCCTVTVGDGVSSHGLFTSIEQAVDYLPPSGGKICLLPGVHRTNVRIVERRNITIIGCDKQTRVIPRPDNPKAALFEVVDSRCIVLQHMDMIHFCGIAVLMSGTGLGLLKEISVSHNRMLAYQQAVRVVRGQDIHISYNHIRMLDKEGAGIAILMMAEDGLIERNDIGVVPARQVPPPDIPDDEVPDPADPCAELELIYRHLTLLGIYVNGLFLELVTPLPKAPFDALGGIRIAAASERVRVIDNTIFGGAGNGITLGGSGLDTAPADDNGDGDEPKVHTVESDGGSIRGFVEEEGNRVPDVSLVFTGEDGTFITDMSKADGTFRVSTGTDDGRYAVVVVDSPGLRIGTVTLSDEVSDFPHRISLVREEVPEPDEALAFLYDIQIDRNEIANMGLSGIGLPRLVPRPDTPARAINAAVSARRALAQVAVLLGYPIISLGIHRNRIHDCLRNPFDDTLRAEVERRGLGGISLGYCEDVVIDGNHIQHNGANPAHPACGMFIGSGGKIIITGNQVIGNGVTEKGVKLTPGIRGGIVFDKVSALGSDESSFDQNAIFDRAGYAARIHDNIVQQPAGQALRIVAVGPLSVCNNRFSTELAGPETRERLAGTLLIVNGGGPNPLPEGTILFNDNQAHLARGNTSVTAQIISTRDDLGCAANQSSGLALGMALTGSIRFFVNTLLFGRTLRANGNRFKEQRPSTAQKGVFRISLISKSALMNNTSNNQGDHCIFPFDTSVVDTGNQELDNSLCRPDPAPGSVRGSIAQPIADFRVVARL